MSFEKVIRIPGDRIGVLIGKAGKTKIEIEESCSVKLEIDSNTGEITLRGSGDVTTIQPFKAVEIVIFDFLGSNVKGLSLFLILYSLRIIR